MEEALENTSLETLLNLMSDLEVQLNEMVIHMPYGWVRIPRTHTLALRLELLRARMELRNILINLHLQGLGQFLLITSHIRFSFKTTRKRTGYIYFIFQDFPT
jgi:hypothetical protein